MTAQIPEEFLNEHPRVDFPLLKLFCVSADLPETPKSSKNAVRSTALWRGYIGTWRLNLDGTLDLLRFTYPHFDAGKSKSQEFTAKPARGDFWLDFRPFFEGPQTKVPFRSGKIVEDREQWQIDDQTIQSTVIKVYRARGLIVQTLFGNAYLPKSLLKQSNVDLETLVNQELSCELYDYDEERRNWIVRESN
ncbi:MAG: hypothetical protein AAF497_28375 [Planctomycetota bacterium]